MTYQEITSQLSSEGFSRVERDDRLLDVLGTETREKGIELWEHWRPDMVDLVRIREPFNQPKTEQFSVGRLALEQALLTNQVLSLDRLS